MPTISDVARRAGVSPATVSRVLQSAKNVRPDTRERVQRAIEELGYVPSVAAQSLRSKRTHSLALVVSDITNTFWTTVARGVEDVAHQHDYSVLLCNTDEDLAKQLRYLDFLISQQVDGVIIAPYDSDARHLEKLRSRKIPTVLVDRRIEGWEVDSVCGDSLAGARALVQHLIALGHTRIAVLSGPASTSTAEDRVAGYCIALSEAGIPLDPRLIMRGEFRNGTGEELTYQLLDQGLSPTAIFATNNAIALGVIGALSSRGLRIPQDIALVCFDDLPNASRLFPFLTVVAQPAYDLGVNAAQLLLSRLGSEVPLRPRSVVLPSRLIIRHSCGSKATTNGDCQLSLPIVETETSQSTLIRPLSVEEQRSFAHCIEGVAAWLRTASTKFSDYDKSDVNRLLQALLFQETDRLPHLELSVMSRPLYEYILQHELEYDSVGAEVGGLSITPEDHVEFALRMGIDAVPCHLSWRSGSTDRGGVGAPPSLAAQLSYLERYLRAAQGTGVGVIASLPSFFDVALRTSGAAEALDQFLAQRAHLEQRMDTLLEHQEKVMRVVCDRFADDLALVVVRDRLADQAGLHLPPDLFVRLFSFRMARLIAPAKEYGKPLLMHTRGNVDQLLPILYEVGFRATHPLEPEHNDVFRVKRDWIGKLAIVGGISTNLLVQGTKEAIVNTVREYCMELAPGGGYVLGSANGTTQDIPPENYVTMIQAVRKYGRYGSLGQEV
jgi:LacI family transcriptional regulator